MIGGSRTRKNMVGEKDSILFITNKKMIFVCIQTFLEEGFYNTNNA